MENTIFNELGHALRWLRDRQGKKQYQVAEAAGITKGMLSAYETGRQKPSLDTLEKIQVCTHYHLNGEVLDVPPSDYAQLSACEPVYQEFPGWKTSTENAKTWDELPENARTYLLALAEFTGAKLTIASVGPGREQTILL